MKSLRIILYIIVAIAVLLLVISEGFIWYVLKPQLKPIENSRWSDSIQQKKLLKDTFIVSMDTGDSLHAYYFRADSTTKNVAILIHGYTDQALMMGKIAEIYDRQLHYNVFLPDLHYHGRSKGTFIQMGWRDRLDVLQWCALADSIFGGNTKQVLHGISMGGATIMSASGEQLPSYIKCFVDDCGYTSVWDELCNELLNQFSLPPFPFMYTTSALNKLQNGWSFGEASPISQVSKCNKPMLFIHGGKDEFVKTDMVYRLYNAKSAPKELCVFHGTGHALSYDEHKNEYTRLVCSFVKKYGR